MSWLFSGPDIRWLVAADPSCRKECRLLFSDLGFRRKLSDMLHIVGPNDVPVYSGEDEHRFRPNVNT
jgi:hypothetical protein